jgi:uncharacterized protein
VEALAVEVGEAGKKLTLWLYKIRFINKLESLQREGVINMMGNKTVYMVALALVVVGAVNWGLYAFGYNLVEMLLGSVPVVEKAVYVVVALSGVYLAADVLMKKE